LNNDRISRTVRLVLILFAFGAVAAATLAPTSDRNSPAGFCILCGQRGTADAILNVLLFAPLGFALALYRLRFRFALLIGLALTFAIEVAQHTLIAGRDASPADVLFNTSGTLLGWTFCPLVIAAASPTIAIARRFGTLWAALLLTIPLLFALLTHPSVTAHLYYGQWTPDLGLDREYGGKLLHAELNGLYIGPHAVPHNESLEEAVATGVADLTFSAAEAVPARSTLFAVAAERERLLLRISVRDDDLLVSTRMRAHDLRLDAPMFRVPDALRGVPVGDTVQLRIERTSNAITATANGVRKQTPIRVSRAWALLYFGPIAANREQLTSMLFLLFCSAPIGFWAAAGGRLVLYTAAAAFSFVVLPRAVDIAPVSLFEFAVCSAGFITGFLLGKLRRPRNV
jgi:glycopeptide antibiotics resistance protein